MTNPQMGESAAPRQLRLWPGVAAGVLLALARFVVPIVAPDAAVAGVLGALLCGVAIIVWWAFFSRASRADRWGALVLMLVAMAVTSRLIHKSIATGMMGMMFVIYAFPVVCLALVLGAVASRRLGDGMRRAWIVAAVLLACGGWTLLRTDGVKGGGDAQLAWRWTATHEERLLAQAVEVLSVVPAAPTAAPGAAPAVAPATAPAAPAAVPAKAEARVEWPGFRGAHRDGAIAGVRIATDWKASPPVELWRREIGPGWSSFAVHGNLLFTQEQRGDHELVACYNVATGKPVWTHQDAARFWESNAGPGPRATPTLSKGRVYTLGATGIVNALDAGSGAVIWSRDAASDTGVKVPGWGFAGSPLVVDDLVIVAAAGRLAAYGTGSGDLRWKGPGEGGGGYSSPQLATIGGVPQVLLLSDAGAISVAPGDGTVLWKYAWPSEGRIVQPALVGDGDVLITSSDMAGGVGIRRIAVSHGPGGWTVEERWTSAGLKPYFNDFVVHEGHAFGFDGRILSCIDLKDGTRKWKGGRYGYGQLVLLPEQDLLLVLSEEGELALVGAVVDQFKELARFPAIEGKTWNHPVLAGDVLVVRNGQEMAAFRVALADRPGGPSH